MDNQQLLEWARENFELWDGNIARQIEIAKIMATCLGTEAFVKVIELAQQQN